MEKIQIRVFDTRKKQYYWMHFCYLQNSYASRYRQKTFSTNMDAHIKAWLKQDFGLDVVTMDDVYKAKELIKKRYAELYPDVFLENEGDRQGWSRVWLTEKINKLLEVQQ